VNPPGNGTTPVAVAGGSPAPGEPAPRAAAWPGESASPVATPTPPPIIVDPPRVNVEPGKMSSARINGVLGSVTATVADPAVATVVVGLGNGLGAGTMMTLGADLAPKEGTGEFLGVWRLMGDSGSTGGPLVVGKIADVVGLSLGAATLAAMGAIASVLLILFVKETLPDELSTPSLPSLPPSHAGKGG